MAALAALLIGLIAFQPLGDLLSKGWLLLIGFLVAAILFLMRIMVLPLWRETTREDPSA